MQSPKRIYQNLAVLLAEGQFPGSAAPAVAEAQELVSRILQEIDRSEEASREQSSGSVVGNETESDRVVSGEVPRPSRKGRKGRSQPA